MNIVHVLIATGAMNAGGAETLIMEMLRHKSETIRYILLIHYAGVVTPGVYDEEIKDLGIPMVYIPSVGSIGEKEYIRVFLEKVKDIGRIDILHSHLNAVGGIIAKAAKKAGIANRIIHCHADITYTGSKAKVLFSEIKLALMRIYVNRFGTEYWACSERAGKRLFYNSKSVKVIPNVIDVEKYLSGEEKHKTIKRKLGLDNRLILGSVGRISQIKNYEFAIETLVVLKKQGIQADFVCYGRIVDESYFSKLQELSKELRVDLQVHFMGNSTEVHNDISGFDVFLMPSISEGFGMAAIEAQAAGIPAIVSTGVPKDVDVGIGLIKYLELNEKEWANAILEIKDTKRPDNEAIVHAFNLKGYNSLTTVSLLESEYQTMVRKE